MTATAVRTRLAAMARADLAAAALVVGLVFVVLFTALDYGHSCDEYPSQLYGDLILNSYAALPSAQDKHAQLRQTVAAAAQINDAVIYRGGTFHVAVQWFSHHGGLGSFGARRLFTALVGVLGIVATVRLSRLLGGPWVGFWSAVLLVFLPTWYGHMFINQIDLPFAVGHTWTLYYLVRLARHLLGGDLSPPRLSLWLRCGVALGLTLGIRLGGVLLVGYLALTTAAGIGLQIWQRPCQRVWTPEYARWLRRVAAGFALCLLAAYPLMLVFWPAALLDPLRFPLAALSKTTAHPLQRLVLFAGQYVPSTSLPPSYLPHYLLVKIPLLHWMLLLMAGVLGAIRVYRRRKLPWLEAVQTLAPSGSWLVWLAVVFPVVYAVSTGPTDYDAIRHFLFVLPPLACLGAVASTELLSGLAKRVVQVRHVAWLLLVVPLVFIGRSMVVLHPYQYIFYNSLVGGVAGARGKYLDDYWGTAFKEAAEQLVTQLSREGSAAAARPYKIAACGPDRKWPAWTAVPFLPPNFTVVRDVRDADFYFTVSKWPCRWQLPAWHRPLVRVERAGVPLALVVDLRHRSERPDVAW